MQNVWFLLWAPRTNEDNSQRVLDPFVTAFSFLSLQGRGTAEEAASYVQGILTCLLLIPF